MRAAVSALAILIVSIGLLAPGAYREFNIYDEGVAVYGAERVANGEVPYRDFWTVYAPGDLYLLAGVFKTFGPTLVVERHAWVLMEGVLAMLVWLLLRRGGADWPWTAIGWITLILWTRQLPFYATPGIPALVCQISAILLVLRYLGAPIAPDIRTVPAIPPRGSADPADGAGPALSGPRAPAGPRARARALIFAGVLVAACTLFRQDSGLYACLSIIASLALARRGRAIVWFLGAVAASLTPVVVALLIAVPIDRLIELLVTFPLQVYPRMRAVPWPGLPANPLGALHAPSGAAAFLREQARFYQLYGSIAVLGVITIWGFSARRAALLLIGLNGLLLLEHAHVRSDVFHLYPTFVFALIAGAIVMSTLGRWRLRWAYPLATYPVALLLAVGLVLSVRSERLARARETAYTLPRAAGLSTLHAAEAEAYQRAILDVQQRVPPGQPIFVGNTRHDRLVVNDVMFYFLAGRPSATAYHDMHPGVVTSAPVQEAMVRDLDAKGVRCVVLRNELNPGEAGNGSGTSSGVLLLDRDIAEHFAPGPTFGDYQVWTRR